MTNEKEQYPKKIVTIENITEDSEETKEVITIVNNEYEEKAVLYLNKRSQIRD